MVDLRRRSGIAGAGMVHALTACAIFAPRRMDDGRTVTIDSDLDDVSMRRVLEALVLRAGGDS